MILQRSFLTFEAVKTYVKYSLVAWMFFFAIVSWVLFEISDMQTAFIRTASFVIPQMVIFYLNLMWFSCKYLEKGKRLTYFGLLFSLVIIHVIMLSPFDIYMDNTLPLDVPHFKDRPAHFIYFGRFMTSFPPLIISALIYKSLQLNRQYKESLELKNKMLHAETKALKAQINPHFLFNSMNNIYSLAQVKSDKTGDAILHLSEILRFVTYESEKDKVNLSDELKQIKNFIQLQFLKDDNQDNVEININDAPAHLKIAPMLLLPFIENSFKHSNFENKNNGWIKIDISIKQNHLIMSLSNSCVLSAGKKDGVGGVGMENVKKRLSLIYPESHTLSIKQNAERYAVILDLTLD